jgi:predicted molibdopterin-dependent oxidoreductase YjgC
MKVLKDKPIVGVPVTIDGHQVLVPEGTTVLQAARTSGVYIPTLCHLDMLPDYGGCRLCMVQIKNMKGFPTACTTPVAKDMEIVTKTEELQSLRREILELILSEHPYTCLVCRDKSDCIQYMHTTRKAGVTTGCNFCTNNGDCELQDLVDYLDLKEIRFPIAYRHVEPVRDNPFYTLDYNLCILCGRCVRICNEERHSDVLAFIQRGNTTLVGTAFGDSQQQAGCEYCGACVDVCPTGSLSGKMGSWAGVPDRSEETICTLCSIGCDMNVNVRQNRIVNVGPAPGNHVSPLQLCVRGKFVAPDIVHHPQRMTSPMIKKENRWVEVSWDEAIQFTARRLEQLRGNHFGMIGTAQDTLENDYILQKFTRSVMQSNHVDLFGSYPEKELIRNIYDYHRNVPPVKINDIIASDALLVFGSRAFTSHPIVENRIRKAYKNGTTVIDANTRRSRTTRFSSLHVTYQPGGEYRFLMTLLLEVTRKKKGSLTREVLKQMAGLSLNDLLDGGGLTRKELKALSDILLKSDNLIIIAGDEVFRNEDGQMIFNGLNNLQQLLGGHCHILFLLDEGNRYGGTMMGMHPHYLGGFKKIDDAPAAVKWEGRWNTDLSRLPGFSSDEMIKNIQNDGITSLFVVGDIPPHDRLSGLQFFVQHNMFLTKTSEYAHVFFPLTSLSEDDGHVINLEGELKKMMRITAPPEDAKPAWQVIVEIAGSLRAPGFNFSQPADIMTELGSMIDLSFKGDTTNRNPLPMKVTFNDQRDFPVALIIEPNGFHYLGNSLTSLMTDMKAIRDEGMLFISPFLAEKMELHDDDMVRVETPYGKIETLVKTDPDLEGNTAGFCPAGEHFKAVTDGINFNRNHLPVKIERIQNG